jgi:hypothetical protein
MAKRRRRRITEDPKSWLAGYNDGLRSSVRGGRAGSMGRQVFAARAGENEARLQGVRSSMTFSEPLNAEIESMAERLTPQPQLHGTPK